MPEAMPRSMPTSWMGVNWLSFSCRGGGQGDAEGVGGEVDGGEEGRGRQGGEWGEEEGVQGRRKEEENEG